MKRRTVALAALTLAACVPSAAPADNLPAAPRIAGLDQLYSSYVYKFCDAGRAVYVYDGTRAGGIAVVPDAPECAR